jgi:RimJ/RimL family protein N-acetyltransferase
VVDRHSGIPVGMMSIMSIAAQFGRAELGHIWYDARVQRTAITTETAYVMLCYLFDELRYRRIEWKCDNNNVRSKNAAIRLGFQYEGLFRKHLIVKSQNRDTAWFSITDDEWPTIKRRLQSYVT